MRKVFHLVVVLMLMLSVSANANSAFLSLNELGTTDHPYRVGALKFADLVKEYTGGSLTVELYQIVSGVKAIEFLQIHKLDIALESTMALSNFVPEVGVLDMPFLFNTKEEAFKILDGKVGAKLAELAETKGFKILAWWDNGFRSITSGKGPIEKPDDLKGLRIRTPESAVYLTTFKTLGAVPIPLDRPEAFSALQLGTIDASENSDSNNIRSRFIEVYPYYSVTKHMYTAEPLIMSLDRFKGLTAQEQEAIMKAAKEAGDYQRQVSIELDNTNMKKYPKLALR